jgi:Helix-turn-helix domain
MIIGFTQLKIMQDLLFSLKQYQAVIKRLDEINEDVTSIKLMSGPGTGYLDNFELMKLLHVTRRTLQRWRKSGRLPYKKIGVQYYYKADELLDSIKTHMKCQGMNTQTSDDASDLENALHQVDCPNCPLFLILIS